MLRLTTLKINICCTYRPPVNSNYETFFDNLQQILVDHPRTILTGDMNINLLDLTNNNVIAYQNILNSNNFKLLNKINHLNSTRTEEFPASILDHDVTDLVENCEFDFLLGNSGISDHK